MKAARSRARHSWGAFRAGSAAAITDIPAPRIDRVSVYLPPAVGFGVMEQIAKKTVGLVWLNPGADGASSGPVRIEFKP